MRPYHIGRVRGVLFAEKGTRGMQTVVAEDYAELVDLLDKGEVRVAQKSSEGWTVNQWAKKAVLLSFRLNDVTTISGGPGGAWDVKYCAESAAWVDCARRHHGRRGIRTWKQQIESNPNARRTTGRMPGAFSSYSARSLVAPFYSCPAGPSDRPIYPDSAARVGEAGSRLGRNSFSATPTLMPLRAA